MKIKKARKKSFIPIIAIAAVLFLGGGVAAYFLISKNNQTPANSNDTSSNVNYDPPTKQEIDASQDAKKNNGGQSEETPTNSGSTGKRTVSVGIAFADYDKDEKAVDIRAFTPDAIEGDGTCTATLTKGTITVSQSSEAFIDSSSSQCEPILIPASKFSSGGVWKLTVSYSSSKSKGTSPAMEVTLDL